jgi:hypothetical protein
VNKEKVCNSDQITRLRIDNKAIPDLSPAARQDFLPNPKAFMPITVVLAVGLDSSLQANRGSVWQSAGYLVTSMRSIKEAIPHIRGGHFDLVLLGRSIPADSRERLAFLVRASHAHVPVVCIADSASDCDSFADATINNEPVNMLHDLRELMEKRAKPLAASHATSGAAT